MGFGLGIRYHQKILEYFSGCKITSLSSTIASASRLEANQQLETSGRPVLSVPVWPGEDNQDGVGLDVGNKPELQNVHRRPNHHDMAQAWVGGHARGQEVPRGRTQGGLLVQEGGKPV
jgi:hypothetical protein